MSTDMLHAPTTAMMPVMSIAQAIQRRNIVLDLAKQVMVKGRDYGIIPGTERKPSKDGTPAPENNVLLKPGAEKLGSLFGLTPVFQDDRSVVDFEHGLFHFSYNCILLRNAIREVIDGKELITGDVVGTCIGSCNSREKKYRRGGKACPQCGVVAIKRSKFPPRDDPQAEPGYYCHDKSGGCGANFAADDQSILELGQSFNPDDAADLVNTMQKMAQKRAYIGSMLIATNASEFFTQDLDTEDHDERPRENRNGGQDWLATILAANDAAGLNVVIERWKEIPQKQQQSINTAMTTRAKQLNLAWSKETSRWTDRPKASPANGQAHKPEEEVGMPSDDVLDEIEMLCSRKGQAARTMFSVLKLVKTDGGLVTKLSELDSNQSKKLIVHLEAMQDARQPGDEAKV